MAYSNSDIEEYFEDLVSESVIIRLVVTGSGRSPIDDTDRIPVNYQTIDLEESSRISSLLATNNSTELKILLKDNGLGDYDISFVDDSSDDIVQVENELKTIVVAFDRQDSFDPEDKIDEKDQKAIAVFIEKVLAVARHDKEQLISEMNDEAARINRPIIKKEFDFAYEGPNLFIEIPVKERFSDRFHAASWGELFLPEKGHTITIRHVLTNEFAEVKGKETYLMTQEVFDKAVCRLNSQYFNQEFEKQDSAIENCLSQICNIEELQSGSKPKAYGSLQEYDAFTLAKKQKKGLLKYKEFCKRNYQCVENEEMKKEYLEKAVGNSLFSQSYYEILQKENVRIREANKRIAALEKSRQRVLAGQKRVVEAFRQYQSDKDQLVYFVSQLLTYSQYGIDFEKDIKVECDENGCLVVEYSLPNKNDLLKNKGCKYNSNLKRIENQTVTDKKLSDSWEKLVYSIALRSIKEVFVNDVHGLVNGVVFNGWCNEINGAIGKGQKACIMSLSCSKSEMLGINLESVNPKQCFRALHGVSCSKITELVPILPVMTISHEDRRFIEAVDVAKEMDDETNLASIDWKDFEQLIREVFSKEFSSERYEVCITQSSRDGGVDAVAFDNDPIRGGKIIIQAKRYTNTVGVSAVRDLYGTVLNEGAMKGILVTTSSFGPDSYSFANDKPLTLLSGGNLLALMERHGYHARIDLAEAKQINAEKQFSKHLE